jgi:hypothetical protein
VAERLGDKPYHEALTVLTAIACAIWCCRGTTRRVWERPSPRWISCRTGV